METCRRCRATLFEDARFCARCLAPVAASSEEVEAAMVEVDAAAGRWRPPPTPAPGWSPDERFTEAPPPKVHSRWRSGSLSFGPAAKLAISAAVLAAPALAWKFAGLYSIGFGLLWMVAVVPRVMRDLWRRSRIR